MNKDRNALKAGTFIVVSFILALAVVVSIKDFGNFAEKSVVRAARFKMSDDLGGLRVGDDLRVGGFKVGSVKSVEPVGLDGKSEQAMVVTFTLPTKYTLRGGAKVSVQTSLTGAAILNIQDLGTGALLSDNEQLAGIPDPKSSFLNNLGDVKVAETVANVNATVTHVRSKIDPAFDRYNTIADRATETMTNARDAMGHARDIVGEGKGDLKGTFANLNATSANVKEKLPEILEKASALVTKLHASVDKVQTTLDDVKATVANTKDVSASARQVISGNKTKLESMIASLKTTGDNLKAASSEIRRSPWRLLYKPGKGEMANLNLYDSARQFAEGANDMNDAAAALRDALNTRDVDAKQLQSLVERLDKSFNSFQKVETQLWERVSVRE
jgi:phospholipid/cholesterol/gamma-HCH transport system substrate-binding protein